MVGISCLACGKSIKLRAYIDAEDYDGEVVCQECGSLLHVKLVKSKVRKYRVVDRNFGREDKALAVLKEIRQAMKGPNDSVELPLYKAPSDTFQT